MPFVFKRLEIPEVILVQAKAWPDNRGFFAECYKLSDFAAAGIPVRFVQDNHSRSAQGVLRGLHYQLDPQAQGKLVSAVRGSIWDVAVDIRRGSPTFGRWVAEELSDENGCQLYVPPGFAHGFCVLSNVADVTYKVTAEYAPGLERGIVWDDPHIGIQWPIPEPILSLKDAQLPSLLDADNSFGQPDL